MRIPTILAALIVVAGASAAAAQSVFGPGNAGLGQRVMICQLALPGVNRGVPFAVRVDTIQGTCQTGATRDWTFVSGDGDVVCDHQTLGLRLIVAPDDSYAVYQTDGALVASGRCRAL
ncbi:hypothetical protein HKCCE2091_00620 [Rhodobacterales bacterium HKCCE2091]|nr:hypothetical protein [Rhodobacterales bacterium HKCCE2091]